jgi:hypothetical protein
MVIKVHSRLVNLEIQPLFDALPPTNWMTRPAADLLNLRAFFRLAHYERDLRVRELRLPHLSSSSRSPHAKRELSKIERSSFAEAGQGQTAC